MLDDVSRGDQIAWYVSAVLIAAMAPVIALAFAIAFGWVSAPSWAPLSQDVERDRPAYGTTKA